MKLIALTIAISIAAPTFAALADDIAAPAARLQSDQAIQTRISDLETTISLTIVPQVKTNTVNVISRTCSPRIIWAC